MSTGLPRRVAARVLPTLRPLLRSGAAVRALQRMDAVTILTYHEVADGIPEALSPGLVTSRARFEREVAWLSRHFEIASLDSAVARLRAGTLRGHAVVLTFDDGYRGVLEHVYPTLATMNLPMTLFLNSAFFFGEQVGLRIKLELLLRRYSWDELTRAIPGPRNRVQFVALARRRLTVSTRDAIDALFDRAAAHGFRDPYLHREHLDVMSPALVTVGNHTRSHQWLAGLARDEQRAEIEEAHRALAALPHFRPYLAVPFGTPDSFDAATEEIAARYYDGLVITSYGGLNTSRGRRSHELLRNSVNEGKPGLSELLWSNHLLSLVSN